jgi:hypothetical protein
VAQQRPDTNLPASDTQRIEREREAGEERPGDGEPDVASGAGRIETGGSCVFDQATCRRRRANTREGIDEELPCDERHTGDP